MKRSEIVFLFWYLFWSMKLWSILWRRFFCSFLEVFSKFLRNVISCFLFIFLFCKILCSVFVEINLKVLFLGSVGFGLWCRVFIGKICFLNVIIEDYYFVVRFFCNFMFKGLKLGWYLFRRDFWLSCCLVLLRKYFFWYIFISVLLFLLLDFGVFFGLFFWGSFLCEFRGFLRELFFFVSCFVWFLFSWFLNLDNRIL